MLYAGGDKKDEGRAFELLTKSAEAGYAHAQAVLGTYLQGGHFVEKNQEEAVAWFQKAAIQVRF